MKRKIIEISETLCNGCGDCINACAEGAIKIVNGKAKLVADEYCDGLGDCLGHCPTGALKIIEREAEAFDESLIPAKHEATPVCSCPSQRMNTQNSPLNNWPIQLSLVPEDGEYFADANLLIAADCTAFSRLHFNQNLQDKILLICCPKLDNTSFYQKKLMNIFTKHNVNSITVARMSVPCCAGLTHLVYNAIQKSGKRIQAEELIIETS